MGKKIKKLLIIEDDMDVLEIMQDYFEEYFEEIQVANNGLEGLEIYKSFQPDVVITDLTMPYMNGLNMSKEIFSINKNQKIILCTAHSENHYVNLANDIGIKYILTKPINIDLLLQYIHD